MKKQVFIKINNVVEIYREVCVVLVSWHCVVLGIRTGFLFLTCKCIIVHLVGETFAFIFSQWLKKNSRTDEFLDLDLIIAAFC